MIDPLSPSPPSLISTTPVPNVHPTEDAPYRLAIIGEAPGETEEQYLTPFVGASGNLLNSLLSSAGVSRPACYIGNVCQHRPPGNDIKAFGKTLAQLQNHPLVAAGWENLKQDLLSFRPNAILVLGNTPLSFLTGKTGITSWRGSILASPYGKVIPAIHPAAVLREYKDWPLLRFDIQRARQESETSEITLPQRTLEIDLSAYEICRRLDSWQPGVLLSFDIEGGLDAFPCCSVAAASTRGFIIAWSKYSEIEQGHVARSLSRVLYRADVPKVLQNSLYDRFVLAYGYRMLIRNVTEDTLLKQWEIYSELPKKLSLQTSIWTREPYYKSTLMIYSGAELKRQIKSGKYDPAVAISNQHKGCILDSCVTLEACLAQDNALDDRARRHYRFNVDLLSPLLYMELRGIRYNTTLAKEKLNEVKVQLSECAQRLTLRAGYSLAGTKGSLSSTKLKKCLYLERGYPEQKKKTKIPGGGMVMKPTTDVEALLNLGRKFQNDPFIADILLHRKLESTIETLEWIPDPKDGRMKFGFNQFSTAEDSESDGGGNTETGRLRCGKSLIKVEGKNVGGNGQTVTKKLRELYQASEGCFLFQCDLAGADGWTVAARCMQHGDNTMWDDYKYGLKPALIIALMYQGMVTNNTSREDLKRLSKAYKQWEADNESEAWIYFGSKRVQHMTNYAGQPRTGVKQIMIDSYKLTGTPIFMTEADFGALQRLYFSRYPGLYQWHNSTKREVFEGRNQTSASGHTRIFFGRRKSWDYKTRTYAADHDTWKEFLANEPQDNTTYATNCALHRLWHDPDNRTTGNSKGVFLDERLDQKRSTSLLIEPLHQVHDALIGQFRIEHTPWAVAKIREYFNNTLEIASTTLTIPFEMGIGPSWGELKEVKFNENTTDPIIPSFT